MDAQLVPNDADRDAFSTFGGCNTLWQDYVPYSRAKVPAVALSSATPLSTVGSNRELFEEHQNWLDEKLILNTARNPYEA